MFDNPILDFIAEPENLALALEVADHVEQIKMAHHKTFWDQIAQEFNDRVQNNAYASDWMVEPMPEDKVFSQYVGVNLSPRASLRHKKRPWLCANLHQGSRNSHYHLYYGLKWTTNKAPALEAVQTLKNEMGDAGFRSTQSNWIGWKWFNYHIYHNDFLVRISENRQLLAKEVVEPLWILFEKHLDQINEINEILGRK